jgi:outer membrane protein assembly factor BamB
MNEQKLIAVIAGGLVAANLSWAAPAEQNWGQWRGPLANGVAPKADPPTEWSETKNVKWKLAIPGEGNATPIVWDNIVFVQSAIPVAK